MADDIAGRLLGTEERASWCGDTDPTGRYVCQRIRNHALDWHECRNDKGGRHMWKVAVDPVDLPFGALLRDPKSGRWAVRFQVDDTTGKGMHAWLVPPTTDHPEVRVLHHVEVRGWQPFEIVIDQVNRLEGERDGILAQLVRFAKEFERVRASREAWAIEADRLDVQVEELTRERDEARAESDAVTTERDKLANDLGDLCLIHSVVTENEDNLRHAGHRIAGLFNRDPEDHQVAGVLRDVAEELIAWRADSSKVPDGWQSLVRKGWSGGASRPAVPAFLAGFVYSLRKAGWSDKEITGFCEDRLGSGLDLPADAENLAWSACMGDDKFTGLNSDQILEVIRRTLKAVTSAPVSGSDTTADGGDR